VPHVPEILKLSSEQLLELIDAGLRPVVGHVLPLDKGAEALRLLESRSAQGKVVLKPS
jgi:NADPH:quinone reductase